MIFLGAADLAVDTAAPAGTALAAGFVSGARFADAVVLGSTAKDRRNMKKLRLLENRILFCLEVNTHPDSPYPGMEA